MKRLNERQSKVLAFLSDFQAEHEYPAVVMDIVIELGLNYSTALKNVHKLQAIGYVDILRERRRIRGIFVLHKE